MDRQILVYVLIALMVALLVAMAIYELRTLINKRAETRRRQLEREEYERIMSRRGK